jgi:hypothetical protein
VQIAFQLLSDFLHLHTELAVRVLSDALFESFFERRGGLPTETDSFQFSDSRLGVFPRDIAAASICERVCVFAHGGCGHGIPSSAGWLTDRIDSISDLLVAGYSTSPSSIPTRMSSLKKGSITKTPLFISQVLLQTRGQVSDRSAHRCSANTSHWRHVCKNLPLLTYQAVPPCSNLCVLQFKIRGILEGRSTNSYLG